MQERRFFRTSRAAPIESFAPASVRERPSSDTPWRSGFAHPPIRVSAEQVLHEESCSFGTVFIISLEDLFRALGGPTDRLVEALRFMGESMFRMRLSPDDKFSYDDGKFRIRLGNRDQLSARGLVEMLVDDLGRRAIGNRFVTWASIHASELETA